VKPPEGCENLTEIRSSIDELDREIVALIGRRARYVEAAARFKTSEKSVRAPERQAAMLAERRRWAEDEGLDPDVIEILFQQLVDYFIAREMRGWRAEPAKGDAS
jgi:isochorismate pyruvate lyase